MSRRVLLIDYDPKSTARIRDLLAGRGIELEVRSDGVTAARDFERVRPALVLVQDLLPKKHGFEVCRELKGSALGRYVPVLLITGIRPGREWELRRTECDGFVRKPFGDDALVDAVERFLPEAAAPAVAPQASPPRTEIPVQFSEEELTARLDALIDLNAPAAPEPSPADEPAAQPAEAPKPRRRTTRKKKASAKRAPRKKAAKKTRRRGKRVAAAASA